MNVRAIPLLISGPMLFAVLSQRPSTEGTSQSAQRPDQPKFQINSNLVVLDIVVTDKNGAVVNDLSRDDFRIYENDVLQTVNSFEHYRPRSSSSRPSIHSTAELDKLEPDAPVSIIVLDEMTTSFEDRAFARYSLQQYLASEIETMEQPTMLVAVGRQHFLVLCDYTTSKKRVLGALDGYHPANDAWQKDGEGAHGETYNAAFAWLMEVAEATAGHRGHKNMIWIGRGFPNLANPTVTAGGITNTLSEQGIALNSAFAICTNALRDARITLYAVDPVGVSSAPLEGNLCDSENGTVFGGQAEFDSIVALTGGKAFHGRNDVDQLIKKARRRVPISIRFRTYHLRSVIFGKSFARFAS